jgi:hypothetical protein
VLERRRGPDHRGAPQARQLRGGDPDATAGIVDEHGLARRERRHAIERKRRSEVGDGHRGCLGVAQGIRQMERLFGRHDDGVGVPAKPRQGDDAIPFQEAGYGAAHRVDVPGDFVADDQRRLGCIGIQAEPREHVGEIDAGRADANPQLPVAR